MGYDDTVIPAVVNALLSGHDLILLGLRGQAKSRLLRMLTTFLDPAIPVIEGAPLRDDPLAPVSPTGKRMLREMGDETPVTWLEPEQRYQEKLATPDVSMADLLGDLDPIKAAARGQSLLDEEAIAYGIIPRSNRGLFAVNELPDLPPRIQVALLNVMEERDVQIRGFPVRFPLDLLLVFSANPEDYTKRGNLITPLRDRIASQIHTHYPNVIEDGMRITEQEAWVDRGGPRIHVSRLARELVEQVAILARESDWVDQSSGVSARLTIALLEAVVANAERRAILAGRDEDAVRLSDFFRAIPAITGKIELVFEGEREGPEKVAAHLIGRAAGAVFDRRFPDYFTDPGEGESPYRILAEYFRAGGACVVSDKADTEAEQELLALPGLPPLMEEFLADLEDESDVFGAELVLEGLHQHSVLAKEEDGPRSVFLDMVSTMWEDIDPKGRKGGI